MSYSDLLDVKSPDETFPAGAPRLQKIDLLRDDSTRYRYLRKNMRFHFFRLISE